MPVLPLYPTPASEVEWPPGLDWPSELVVTQRDEIKAEDGLHPGQAAINDELLAGHIT